MALLTEPALLRGRDRYERVTTGRVDNTHDDAFTHTVRLEEPDRALEVEIVATPSPDYAIRAARCGALRGEVAASVVAGVASLAGVAMVGGLTRRAMEVTGGGAGAALAVDGVLEVARLARQVAKLPGEQAARAASRDPRECWQLDRAAWVDLPDSCFTYSDAGGRLFGTRPVTTPIQPDLYHPRPGQRGVFERRKVARLERRAGRLALFHSMHDNVHGFELRLEIDAASGAVVSAEHVTPRLPYRGICDEPQKKLAALVGERADHGLRRRIQLHLGGPTGCAQLYDLTADLLKLLAARS
ncbi:MAG TPA: DUF2889 domain-containing protein [Patescibacteria group bacterium]|nr:DUF2889 domain-containing protein [Patescibacteria group bacterium]